MIATIHKVWTLFTTSERRRAIFMLALIVLMAFAETAGVLSIIPFLSVLGRPEVISNTPWLRSALEVSGAPDARVFTVVLGLASIVIVIGASLFKTLTQHAINRFIHFLRHSISTRLLAAYLHQPYAFFLTRNTAELNRNILSEADQLLSNLIQPLAQLVAQGMVVLAMVVLIIAYDPAMAAAIISVVGSLYGAIYWLVRKRLSWIGTERMAANRERYQAATEVLGGIKDVKVTQSVPAYTERFSRASREYSRHMAASETLSQTPLYLVEATGYTGLIVIALFLLMRSNDIAHVLPALGLYGFAAYRMLPAAQIMYRGFAKLRFSSSALEVLYRDLSLRKEAHPSRGNTLAPHKEIRLDRIRFAYPGAPDRPIFDNFNLVIPANTTVGIVGKSGAGKSTLMDLLLGLLHPQAGTLQIDGTVIDASNVADWQRSIGYVPQHIFLADATVAENIAFGVPKDRIDMSAVKHAAQTAQIHDVIESELPDGYQTPIGERGIRLSGGQRQRIGIARALYNNNKLLILDEATSALDQDTEHLVLQGISCLEPNRTIIVVAHGERALMNCAKKICLDVSGMKTDPNGRKNG